MTVIIMFDFDCASLKQFDKKKKIFFDKSFFFNKVQRPQDLHQHNKYIHRNIFTEFKGTITIGFLSFLANSEISIHLKELKIIFHQNLISSSKSYVTVTNIN